MNMNMNMNKREPLAQLSSVALAFEKSAYFLKVTVADFSTVHISASVVKPN